MQKADHIEFTPCLVRGGDLVIETSYNHSFMGLEVRLSPHNWPSVAEVRMLSRNDMYSQHAIEWAVQKMRVCIEIKCMFRGVPFHE